MFTDAHKRVHRNIFVARVDELSLPEPELVSINSAARKRPIEFYQPVILLALFEANELADLASPQQCCGTTLTREPTAIFLAVVILISSPD